MIDKKKKWVNKFKKSQATKTRKDYWKDYATKERILKSFKIGAFQEIETLNCGEFISVDLTLLYIRIIYA